jgi:hypothetical protein
LLIECLAINRLRLADDVPSFGDLQGSRWAGVRTGFQLPAVRTTW